MAQENTVSFKVFLFIDDSSKTEVRRFGIDRDVVSNFTYLSEKLQNVFVSLRNKRFDVYWKDSEGDDVLISTDDELMIALTEMQGDVRKLVVVINGDQVKEDPPKRSGGKTHPGVVCDECENGISGFRYKCLECSNYDLCSSCESKGLHPDHFMIRLPVPVTWRPHFGKRLAYHLAKSSRKCNSSCPADDSAGGAEGCSHARYGHVYSRWNRHIERPAGLLEALGAFVGGWINDANAEYPVGGNTNQNGEKAKNPEGATANGQTQTTEGSSKSKDEQSATGKTVPPNQDAKLQYLQDVGKAVASLLDPFGIDVDVRVDSTKTSENPEGTQQTEEKTKKNVSFADEAPNTNKGAGESGEAAKQSVNSDAGLERESPEKDGWTLVPGTDAPNQESSVASGPGLKEETSVSSVKVDKSASSVKTEQAGSASAIGGVSTSTGAVPKSQGIPVFYPPPPTFTNIPTFPTFAPVAPPQWHLPPPPAPLPIGMLSPAYHLPPKMQQQQQQQPPPQQQQHQQQQQRQQQPHPLHPDPKINQTIEAMMSMGFSNEGGWLSQLVEMKNGDIEKVLDLLQPVKRS